MEATAMKIVSAESENDEFQIEYEIVPFETNEKIREIDQQLESIQNEIDKYNHDLDRLTNHADGMDYTVAVVSGIVCGLIDSFVVGELLPDDLDFSSKGMEEYIKNAHIKVNKFVESFAKANGLDKGSLKRTVPALEKHFKMPQDNAYQGSGISSALAHHLDDLAHHPTPLGLVAGILAQVLRIGIFSGKKGDTKILGVETDMEDLKKYFIEVLLPLLLGATLSGVCCWLANIAEEKYEEKYQKEIPEPIKKIISMLTKAPAVIPILKLAYNWFGHLVSDMAGSKQTTDNSGGMGIPGIFLSFLKELSMLPPLNKSELPQLLNDLYTSKKLLGFKLDLRTEVAIVDKGLNIVKKQMLPVMINEVLVRSFYFIRRLITGIKNNGIENIDWRMTIPFDNRTIIRMLTIATGTFTAVDIGDAAIRAVVKSGGVNPNTAKEFILRVNFVGVGRMVIAVSADAAMGLKSRNIRREIVNLNSQQLHLLNAKVAYRQADMWIMADDTAKAIKDIYRTAEESFCFAFESMTEIEQNLEKIDSYLEEVEENNPGLKEEMLNTLLGG